MNTQVAIDMLETGHKVRRENWNDGVYLVKNGGELLMYDPYFKELFAYQLAGGDIFAKNWEVMWD